MCFSIIDWIHWICCCNTSLLFFWSIWSIRSDWLRSDCQRSICNYEFNFIVVIIVVCKITYLQSHWISISFCTLHFIISIECEIWYFICTTLSYWYIVSLNTLFISIIFKWFLMTSNYDYNFSIFSCNC